MQKNYTLAISSGAVGGGGSSGCGGVGSITWETPLDTFLQASTISSLVDEANECSLKDLNTNVISVIQAEQGKGLSPEAFMYNGESPLHDRSQKLVQSMQQVDTSLFSQVVESIQALGDVHRYEEAYTSYCKRLEEYSRRYNEELCPAVDTYNKNVYSHNYNESSRVQSDPSYQASFASPVTVTASQESEPSISPPVNASISGATELIAAYDDCVKFYNEYVVPAKELHDECSKSEYVTPQEVPQYDFPKHPKAGYESVAEFFAPVGEFFGGLLATIGQGACMIVDGVVHFGEWLLDGAGWLFSHTIGGLVGGLGTLLSGQGFTSGYKAVTENFNNMIAVNHADNLREWFYGTPVGKALDDNAWFGFTHDSKFFQVGSTITSYAVPLVAATLATVFTGGAASPLLATVGGSAITEIGAILGLTGLTMGIGKTSQEVYQETGGKDTVGGTVRILGSGAIHGFTYMLLGNSVVPKVASAIRPLPPTTPTAPVGPTAPQITGPTPGETPLLPGETIDGTQIFANGNKLYPSGILEYPDGSIVTDAVVNNAGEVIGTQSNGVITYLDGTQAIVQGGTTVNGATVNAAGEVINTAPTATTGTTTINNAAGEIMNSAQSTTVVTENAAVNANGLTDLQLAGRQGGYVAHANSLADQANLAVETYGANSPEAIEAIGNLQEAATNVNITGDQIAARGLNSSYGTGHFVTGPSVSTPATSVVNPNVIVEGGTLSNGAVVNGAGQVLNGTAQQTFNQFLSGSVSNAEALSYAQNMYNSTGGADWETLIKVLSTPTP